MDPGIRTVLSPGWLYLALCLLPVSVGGPVLLQDLLAPAMLLELALRHRERAVRLLREEPPLVLYLLWTALASITHVLRRSGGFYDAGVFGYMAFLYLYYRCTGFPGRARALLGAGMLALIWGGWLLGLLAPEALGGALFHRSAELRGTDLGLLQIRYQALFGNPNLLGLFYPVPLLLLAGWWGARYRGGGAIRRTALLVGAFAACLPLFATVSKHFVLSFAVVLAVWLRSVDLRGRAALLRAGWVAVVLAGCVCWCTALWLTFPLKGRFPYIDTGCRSNYSLHQEIYLRMLGRDLRGLLLGRGPRELRELYPQYADRETIARVLERYHGGRLADRYATFMDPHNEFLNQASFFGVPGLLLLAAFLLGCLARGVSGGRWTAVYFLSALLMCCLWDDALSKRFVWIGIALATAALPGGDEAPGGT